MARRSLPLLGVAFGLIAVIGLAQDKETPDHSRPVVIAVAVHSDVAKADCAKLEGNLKIVRKEFEDKNVLFLRIDVSTRGERHQSKMLLNSLGLDNVWSKHGRMAGKLFLVDPVSGDVVKTIAPNDDAKKIAGALNESLSDTEADEAEEDEDMGDEGCDDGCGCGDEDDDG